ncbi:hypothetical protein QVA48_01525 [Staphylococcus haemolyticus]|uniref:hypothetical protein n=1 Tax=Staphylococcus haemolyticus TaxID=1283 RepID=UPI0028FFBDB2|nr:hypothetical protein [Staphylococcus haemolyticus]MDU0433889.1 hypothetical protein [Staphylococcus haemolyticus]
MPKIIDLDEKDFIWFVPPNSQLSYYGYVKELKWNFEGEKESAIITIGDDEIEVEIDDTYQIAIGRKYNAKN